MRIRIAAIVMLVCVCAQIICAADPLLVQVSCQGCSNRIDIPDGYKFYADAGKSVTLTASSTGGVGSKSHSWTRDGNVVCDRASFQLTVGEDSIEYILIVADRGGSVSKTIRVVPNLIQESKCLPDFRGGITIRDRVSGRTEYSAGDSFTVRVCLETRYCPDSNYEFYWTADDENIIFANPNSTETEVRIGQGICSGKVKIEAIITNGEVIKRPKDGGIEIEIVGNTPPQFDIECDGTIYSCERFEVWPSNFEPGERGESGDFLHSCSAVLRNENGSIVSSAAPRTVRRDGKIPHLRLKPDGFKGVYSIEMTVEDSHLASTTMVEYIGNILRGKNDRNAPIVYTPDIIYCIVGEVCEIDASETEDKDKYVSNFGFYNVVTKERLSNLKGDYCSGSVCNHIFTYPGTYRVKIEANYFNGDDRRESEVGSKIVTVIVGLGNVSVAPAPILISTPVPVVPVSKPTARVEVNAVKEPETEKGGFKKILSDIMDKIKNALNL